jgi:hypothetical protein
MKAEPISLEVLNREWTRMDANWEKARRRPPRGFLFVPKGRRARFFVPTGRFIPARHKVPGSLGASTASCRDASCREHEVYRNGTGRPLGRIAGLGKVHELMKRQTHEVSLQDTILASGLPGTLCRAGMSRPVGTKNSRPDPEPTAHPPVLDGCSHSRPFASISGSHSQIC